MVDESLYYIEFIRVYIFTVVVCACVQFSCFGTVTVSVLIVSSHERQLKMHYPTMDIFNVKIELVIAID